ncbi:MAG: right-handed parallel beta-helix repeat-containing protein [Candidatus Auribacterota bacterium]|nr:right-handed parallel beta-helix repeat-containing protein [Candidatus Auribacterota bacterium]
MMKRRIIVGVFISLACLLIFSTEELFATAVVGDVNSNQTWTAAGSPYVICKFGFTVQSTATLTIESGVEVKLSDAGWLYQSETVYASFDIEGGLNASGTTFTSYSAIPQLQDWERVYFRDGSWGNLTDCTFEYGGAGAVTYAIMHTDGDIDLNISGCAFQHAINGGIYLTSDTSGNMSARYTTFSDLNVGVNANRDAAVTLIFDNCDFGNINDYALHLRNSRATITGCTFSQVTDIEIKLWESWVDNWYCQTSVLENNQFFASGKKQYPVIIHAGSSFTAESTTLSGYDARYSGVGVGGNVPDDGTALWGRSDLPYYVGTGDTGGSQTASVTVEATGADRGSLAIEAGNTVRFNPSCKITAYGDFNVWGTQTEPVTFTSSSSNHYGSGVWFTNYLGNSEISYCDFESLSRGITVWNVQTDVTSVDASYCSFSGVNERAVTVESNTGYDSLNMTGATFTDCFYSLYADNAGFMSFSDCAFRNTGEVYVCSDYGTQNSRCHFQNCNFIDLHKTDRGCLRGYSSALYFQNCTVSGNDDYGINNYGGGAFTALTDCIIWGNGSGSMSSDTYYVNYCCVEGGYSGTGNIDLDPLFVGWSGGTGTLYVDASNPPPGSGTSGDPYTTISSAIEQYRNNYSYGLRVSPTPGSPCIGTGWAGGNMGAANGTGEEGVKSVNLQVAAGDYELGGKNFLHDISLYGADESSVRIFETIIGLETGAVLDGVTLTNTGGQPGVYLMGDKSPTISNCTFSDLTDNGIELWDESSPTISNCRFYGFMRPGDEWTLAIPIYCRKNSDAVINNCLIYDNDSGDYMDHGGIYVYDSDVEINNCTLWNNRQNGICASGSSAIARIKNSIIYQSNRRNIIAISGTINISYSLYDGKEYTQSGGVIVHGSGNLNSDPLFIDGAGHDFHLRSEGGHWNGSGWTVDTDTSPCIDTGDPASDYSNEPSPNGGRINMGVYGNTDEASKSQSAGPTPTAVIPTPTVSSTTPIPPTPIPTPTIPPTPVTPTATPTPSPGRQALPWIYDYDGDGTSDIGIFRETSGLWAIRGITRVYFGSAVDETVPGDYDGDGTTDIGIFRPASGLWAIRGVTRAYFGGAIDETVPGDYNGDGTADVGIFRNTSGLWAIRGVTRAYFGGGSDLPVPGYYGDGTTQNIGIYRGSSGLWAIRGITRVYFGGSTDEPVPGDYSGEGSWLTGIFRPASGLWAIRGVTRSYFGSSSDDPVPADYSGADTDDIGIFRSTSGLWAAKGITRVYFGGSTDLPVTR